MEFDRGRRRSWTPHHGPRSRRSTISRPRLACCCLTLCSTSSTELYQGSSIPICQRAVFLTIFLPYSSATAGQRSDGWALSSRQRHRRYPNILSQAKSLTSVKLGIFATNRTELPIRLGFGDIKGKYRDMVLHEIPEPIIKHDIKAFLDDEFAKIRSDYNGMLPKDLQLPLDWPGEKIIQALVHIAIPLFILLQQSATISKIRHDPTRRTN